MSTDRSRVPAVVAIDLGGTFTKFALADAGGGLHREFARPTVLGPGGADTIRWVGEQILAIVADNSDDFEVRGFGVAVPGVIDSTTGTVRAAANIDWYEVPLRSRLIELTGIPGRVDHDVRAGGLAEWRLGSAVAARNLIFLPLGTGIAAALVVDGRMLEADGYAGELGHSRVAAAGNTSCVCGRVGCLEIVSSAAGVVRSYLRLSGSAEVVDARAVAARARAGDQAAVEAFTIATDGLVEALDMAVALLGPEQVTIGGGLAGAADLFLPQLEQRLAAGLSIQRMPKITKAAFGAQAGVIGAALIGWDALPPPEQES